MKAVRDLSLNFYLAAMTAKLVLLAAFIFSMMMMSYRRKRKQRIVFFGDSLTEHGNKAGGYIKRIQEYLVNEELNEKYELIGAGVSGNTVADLLRRLSRDILSRGAEWVVIFIGVNDVYSLSHPTETPVDVFEDTYRQIIERLKQAEIKTMLCTPAARGEKPLGENLLDDILDAYCNIIRKLAAEYELALCDLRQAFFDYNLQNNVNNVSQGILTTDGIHLNDTGNKFVAMEIWNVLSPVLQ